MSPLNDQSLFLSLSEAVLGELVSLQCRTIQLFNWLLHFYSVSSLAEWR